MKWKCEECGQTLSGEETVCPKCSAKAVYRCEKCGKEMNDGKYKYCPLCKLQLEEDKKAVGKVLLGGLGAVLAVGASIAALVLGGKSGGNDKS